MALPPSARRSPAKSVNRPPASSTITWIGGQVPQRDADRVDGAVSGSLRHEHVGPEVPVGPRVPGLMREARQRPLEREAEDSVLDAPDRRDVDAVAAGIGARASLGPPAPAEGRSRDEAHTELAVLLERDQRRPHGHAARVVASAVDGVDDPPASARAAGTVLLAEHRVPWPLAPQSLSDRRLHGGVRLGHGGRVGLRAHDEVARPEACRRDRVGGVCEGVGEREVGRHLPEPPSVELEVDQRDQHRAHEQQDEEPEQGPAEAQVPPLEIAIHHTSSGSIAAATNNSARYASE